MYFELNETQNTRNQELEMQLKLPNKAAIVFLDIYLKELKVACVYIKTYI